MLTTLLWAVAFIGGLLSFVQMILDGVGTFQTAKDVFQHRGRAVKLLGNILTSRWLSPTLCILSIAVLYLIEFGIPSAIWDTDLRVSIPRYTFNEDTGKLVSEVYFVNHGKTRRAVMAVHFTVRSKSSAGDERQMLIDGPKELYAGGRSFYIAPNEPITQSFEQTIEPALLRVEGNIFGFHFYTLSSDGRPNYTNVDVLEIVDGKSLGMAPLTKRVEHVSLDKRWDKKTSNKWKKTALAALVAIILAAAVWALIRQRPNARFKARLSKLSRHLDEQIEDGARRIEQIEERREEVLTDAQRHEAWEKDQADKGVSIHLPRSFTPPTAAQRQQLADFEQKLVNLRVKGKQLLATPESPSFDIPGVILRHLKFTDEVQGEITRLEDAQRNLNAPARSLRPIEVRDLMDRLIEDGELLMRLWKMRLESMAASQRYDQSTKWLSSGTSTAKRHLTIQQFDQVNGRLHNDNAMDPGDRAMFALAIIHAGVKSDSADYELAIQVASRLEVLRNLRRVFTQLS